MRRPGGKQAAPPLQAAPLLEVGGFPLELRLSERRRSVAIKVGPQGAVVYAPRHLPFAQVEAFVRRKESWVLGHLLAFSAQQRPAAQALDEGALLPLLGHLLTVRLEGGSAARREGDTLLLPSCAAERARAAEAWYRREALAHFTPLVRELAARLGRPVGRVLLTDARGRWGSCTAAGDIRLHWRLLLAPAEVAHYVAAHEVAHLAELNHSPRYWAQLACLMPDYPTARRWLREHGQTLYRWDER